MTDNGVNGGPRVNAVDGLADTFSIVLLGSALLKTAGVAGLAIRHAVTEEDYEAVRELRTLHGQNGLFGTDLEWDDADGVLIASDAARVVGSLRLVTAPWADLPLVIKFQRAGSPPLLPPGHRYAEAGKLVVAADHRHFGVSAALLLAALNEVGRSGADGVLLSCFDHLVPYYRRMGFRPVAHYPIPPSRNLLALDDVGFPRFTAVQALVAALSRAPLASPLA